MQLVGVLSYGKVAKRITDCAIDKMQDVQNLRKATYEYVPRDCKWLETHGRQLQTQGRSVRERKREGAEVEGYRRQLSVSAAAVFELPRTPAYDRTGTATAP